MAQRRFHYEQAFEHYLRANRVPYVAVDEAKKSLLPAGDAHRSLKSFDFVVYTSAGNLFVDVKGRMYGSPAKSGGETTHTRRRYESWVTQDDVDSLRCWRELFGEGFRPTFVFLYCLRQQPPDVLFEQVFSYNNRWYAMREVDLEQYRRVMVQRSAKWQTVHVPAAEFERISCPFMVRPAARP